MTWQGKRRKCPHCETEFDVPEGRHAVAEYTCDMPPPARYAVWSLPLGMSAHDIDWKNPPPILHACRNGVLWLEPVNAARRTQADAS